MKQDAERRAPPRSGNGRLPGVALNDRKLPDLGRLDGFGARVARRAVRISLQILVVAAALAVVLASTVSIDVVVEGAGVLEPRSLWPVRSSSTGFVSDILVSTGEIVRPGQPIVRLDSLELRATLRELEAEFAGIDAEYRRAAEVQPIEQQAQAGRVAQSQAEVVRARAGLLGHMTEFGIGSSVDSLLAEYVPGRSIATDIAVAELSVAMAELRIRRAEQDRLALERYELQRRRSELTGLRAAIGVVRERLGRLTLQAPAGGMVLTEEVERLQGKLVQAGELLVEVASLDRWIAVLAMKERDVHRIQVGDSARLRVGALDRSGGRLIQGRVSSVAAEPGSSTVGGVGQGGRYRVVVDLLDEGPDGPLPFTRLRRGYAVDARIMARSGTIIRLLWDRLLDSLP